MTSAVPVTVQSILKDALHPEAFKKTDEGKQKKKHGSKSNSDKKHKHGSKQSNIQQILHSQVAVAMPSLLPQPQMASVNTILPTSMVSIPSGFSNQGTNVQYVTIPAGQMPPFSFSDFNRGRGDFHRGSGGRSARFRGRIKVLLFEL